MDSVATWVGVVVAATGLGLVAWQLRQASHQRKVEIGLLYVQRYWQIDDDLLQTDKGTPAHDHHRHRYLRLCEDEYSAANEGWLADEMWDVWHAWLTDREQVKRINADLQCVESNSPDTQFELIRLCMSGDSGHSVVFCPARTRARRAGSIPAHTGDAATMPSSESQ